VAAGFDEASRTVFAFGGRWANFYLYPYEDPFLAYDDLQAWSVDRGSWSRPEAQGTGPSRRSDAATAFDPARRRLWILGGTSVEGRPLDDTWALELDGGPRWREVPASGPSGRDRAAAIFDARDDRVILYGGVRGDGENEVWQLKNDAWSLLTVEGSIPPRLGAMAVYDSKRHRMIVLGGAWYDKFDTWAPSLDEVRPGPASRAAGRARLRAPAPVPSTMRTPIACSFWRASTRATSLRPMRACTRSSSRRSADLATGSSPRARPRFRAADHLAFFDRARNRLLVTGGWDGFSSQKRVVRALLRQWRGPDGRARRTPRHLEQCPGGALRGARSRSRS
jgi:hypothetical protein